jgi:hypothetical protein
VHEAPDYREEKLQRRVRLKLILIEDLIPILISIFFSPFHSLSNYFSYFQIYNINALVRLLSIALLVLSIQVAFS